MKKTLALAAVGTFLAFVGWSCSTYEAPKCSLPRCRSECAWRSTESHQPNEAFALCVNEVCKGCVE
jgi:hypothetical protein